jgi:hypothetical protein
VRALLEEVPGTAWCNTTQQHDTHDTTNDRAHDTTHSCQFANAPESKAEQAKEVEEDVEVEEVEEVVGMAYSQAAPSSRPLSSKTLHGRERGGNE